MKTPNGSSPSRRHPGAAWVALALAAAVCDPGRAAAQSPEAAAPAATPARLVVAPAELEPGGSRLLNQGTFAIGSFNEKDLAKFDAALRAAVRTGGAADAPVWELYAVLRSYMMHTTGSSAEVIACAAWCLADGAGRIVFHEQFFSAGSVKFIGTPGGLKAKVNEKIVQRIARRVGVLRQQPAEVAFSESQDPGTYDGFASALARVPALRVFESSHLERVETGTYYWLRVYHLTDEVQGWDWAARTDFIDWPQHVAARRALPTPPGR